MNPQIILVSKIPGGTKCEYFGAPNFTANPEHLWTVSELAAFLRVHPGTVRVWVRDRKISYIRVGKSDVRFRKSDIDEYLESRLKRRKSASR